MIAIKSFKYNFGLEDLYVGQNATNKSLVP